MHHDNETPHLKNPDEELCEVWTLLIILQNTHSIGFRSHQQMKYKTITTISEAGWMPFSSCQICIHPQTVNRQDLYMYVYIYIYIYIQYILYIYIYIHIVLILEFLIQKQ